MTEYESIFKRKELHDMYDANDVNPFDDLYFVEDAALTIKQLNDKIAFYKTYKKKKIEDISNSIAVLENQANFFKGKIISTLVANKEKSIKFPGSCTASLRNQKASWKIQDEEEFIHVLKEAEKKGENIDNVLEEVKQFNIIKKEASKILDQWEDSGKFEDFMKKAKKGEQDVLVKNPSKIIVSLSFVKKEKVAEDIPDVPVVSKKGTEVEDFDNL